MNRCTLQFIGSHPEPAWEVSGYIGDIQKLYRLLRAHWHASYFHAFDGKGKTVELK